MLSIDRTKQCQFLNFRSSGNHQKPPNSFDLWWVSFCRYHQYRRSYVLYLKLACIELNRYVHDELTVSTSLSTSSVPLSLLREVRNCWPVGNTMEIFWKKFVKETIVCEGYPLLWLNCGCKRGILLMHCWFTKQQGYFAECWMPNAEWLWV